MKKGSVTLFFALLLALAGMAVSLLTIFEHSLIELSQTTGVTLNTGLCTAGQTFNCKKVIGNEWSYLFGVPIGYFGLGFYLLIVALAVTAFDERFVNRALAGATLFTFSSIAVLISAFLFYISMVEIGALCPLCLTTYGINVLLLFTTFFIDRSLPLVSRFIEGCLGVARYPLMLFRIGAPRDSLAPTLARVWLVAAILGVMWIMALPDFIANRLVYPRAQSAHDSEQATRALELWHAAPVQNISFSPENGFLTDSFKGSVNAPVTVVEFSDFQCPACRSAHLALSPIWEEFRDSVLFVHKNYPLDHACNSSILEPFHRLSCFAAEFVRCAGEQGMFLQAADLMFRSPVLNKNRDGEAEKAALFEAGEQLGFDRVGLEECVTSGRHRQKIAADIAEADGLGLEGTPTFWIAGRKVPSMSPEVIRSVLLEALSDSSKPRKSN